METERSRRRFTILDGLLLMIVMAAALLAAKSDLTLIGEQFRRAYQILEADPRMIRSWLLGRPPDSQFKSVHKLMTWSVINILPHQGSIFPTWLPARGVGVFLIRQCVLLVFPILVGLSFALLLLRLVRPRPGWPELARQPGALACLAAVAALFLAFWVEELFRTRISLAFVGAAVGLAWVALGVSRSWRSEDSWIDRTGRVLGVCWLLAGGLAAI